MKKNFTKTLVLGLLMGLFSIHNSFAQQADTTSEGANLIKVNVASLFLKTYAVQYERAIGKKTSVGLGLRFMPKSTLPFSSAFDSIDDQIGRLKLGNFAVTPEIKFYMGKGVFKGFYVAPFVKLAKYNASINYTYEVNGTTQSIPLDGNLTTSTGGILLGAQWRIAKKVYFDWSIFGPQYGFSDGMLTGKKSLNNDEQQALRDELKDLEDLPVGKAKTTVDANGVTVKLDGPWAGIRANIGIGYRF